MPAAMDALRAEHKTMSHLLSLLEQQVELFEQAEQPDYDLIKEIIDYFLTYPDLCHHPKENLILRKLRIRNPALAEAAAAGLEDEHDDLSDHLRNFSHAVVNTLLNLEVPRDTFIHLARNFIDRERKHMASEEREFFPAAMKGLSDDDWDEIDVAVKRIKDPLNVVESAMRFDQIRRHLDASQSN